MPISRKIERFDENVRFRQKRSFELRFRSGYSMSVRVPNHPSATPLFRRKKTLPSETHSDGSAQVLERGER